MRIAYFSDAYHPRVSGQVASMDELCKGLVKRGHEVCIVCPSYPEMEYNKHQDSFPTVRIPSGSGIASNEDRLALPWGQSMVDKAMVAFNPQIVHMQTEFTIGAMGRKYCHRNGLPIISTCHTYYELYFNAYFPFIPKRFSHSIVRSWLRHVYKDDSVITTPSQSIRGIMQGYGIDKRYEVIPNGVDDSLFHPKPEEAAAFRQKLAAEHPGFEQGPLLLYVGRIRHEKNLELLAKAMPVITARVPTTRLLLVGEGSQKPELEAFFQNHKLKSKIAWMSYMPREMLPAVYSAADVFVFPSKTETFGLVTIEAMLCGTPVVGVDRMGTGEVLKGNRGGLLTEDDPEDFAHKTISLLTDTVLRNTKAREAMNHAQTWTIGSSCDRFEEIYGQLIKEGPPSSVD